MWQCSWARFIQVAILYGTCLPNAAYPDDAPVGVAPWVGVEQHLDARPGFRVQGELEGRGRGTGDSPLEDLANDLTVVWRDELLHEVATHSVRVAEAGDGGCLLVPNVDLALRVDPLVVV